MKQKLRFLLPHEPLKVLRGEPDEEDEQDRLFARFQAPPGTTTEEENENIDSDHDDDDVTSDTGDVSDDVVDDVMERHVGNRQRLQDGVLQDFNEQVAAVAQVHHLPTNDDVMNSDDALPSDDTAALLPTM